ncbi:uncharacterized protein LOC116349191 [Contarinia nasturtii]|uniref:uncharacterized protein LOC116349191 n=1 Tax=Contarinia nasturtii TaxID=265458 RepID=UPI0012D414C0|nr:uncharacterized protein LOC116349191 [Contarinia nasturtii]
MCNVLLSGPQLIFVLLLTYSIRIHCLGERASGKDDQDTNKITFLNEPLQFPSTVNAEMLNKIRKILSKYEDEAELLGKQANDCRNKNNNLNCQSISEQLEIIKENLRKELNNLKSLTSVTLPIEAEQPKNFIGNGIMFDRIFNVFRDYVLYINFVLNLNTSSAATSGDDSAASTPTAPVSPSTED